MADGQMNRIKLVDGSYIDINDSRLHVYRSLTGTAAVTSSPYYCSRWDVTDPLVTAYEDGMVVCVKVPVAGNGTYGTGLQINSLGYKPMVYNVNSMISTRYSVGSIVWAVYNATQTGSLYLNSASATTVTGCFQVMGYDSNTTSISTLVFNGGSRVVTGNKLGRYNLSFAKNPNAIIPWHNLGSSTSTSKTMTTEEFDPFQGVFYYSTSSTINAGDTVANSSLYWKQSGINMRYSLNVTTTSFTTNNALYAVIAKQSSGYFKFASPYWSQTLPSTNDGLYYMFIGYAYSGYQIELYPFHPIYYHDGTKLCVYGGDAQGGGGGTTEIFWVTPEVTTFAEITAALNADKIPICIYEECLCNLCYKDQGEYDFSCLVGTNVTYIYVTTTNEWEYANWDNQEKLVSGTNIKTINNTSIVGSGNIDVKDVLIATYNVTSWADVSAAYNAGKLILVKDGNDTYYQFYSPSGNNYSNLSFVYLDPETFEIGWIEIDSNGWTKYSKNTIQQYLVSGTNIKTINNNSILGSGNITISGEPTALTNPEVIAIWTGNSNYIKLSGTSFSSGSSGTVTEIGSGYSTSDLTNNRPVIYDGNDNVITNTGMVIDSTNLTVINPNGSGTYSLRITTAASPATYSCVAGGSN